MTKEHLQSNEFKGNIWKTEVYVPKQDQWATVSSDITTIYTQAFSYIEKNLTTEQRDDYLQSSFDRQENTSILLRDSSDTIHGFSIAVPMMGYRAVARDFVQVIRKQYPDEHKNLLGPYLTATKAKEALQSTAYISITAISPLQQGNGLVSVLTGRMEEALQSKGYAYMERDCVADYGYAQKVFDFYTMQGRIEYASPIYRTSMGNKQHFRVWL